MDAFHIIRGKPERRVSKITNEHYDCIDVF